MRRRDLLATLVAAAAAPGLAFAGGAKTLALSKAFPYLDAFLGLAPAQRSRFYIAYRAMRGPHPAPDAKAVIVAPGGARTPLALDREGGVIRLPSLAELKGGVSLEIEDPTVRIGPELRPAVAASTHVDVGELAAALAQLNVAVGKIAGALSFAVPKMTAAYFPGAAGGQWVSADGHAAPLPTFTSPVGPLLYFEPAAAPGAKTVTFAKAPSRILLGGHPKKA
jgi:hypothetical protein